jgi:hypothetical protein
MRFAILLAAVLTTSASAMADAIRIISPDHAQTFAYGEMISHQLHFDRTAGQLVARITFTNSPYADSNDPRRDESFDFWFPSVRYDSARDTFFVKSEHGELIPVARFRERLACGWVDMAPGAKIYLVKEIGRVTATLTATNYPRAGGQWVEMDNNFSLQNVLIALFGSLQAQSEN